MDVSATGVLRTLTNTPDREEAPEIDGPSFAEFLGGPDHNMWFGDVISQQQAAFQNQLADPDESAEPMTSVERAVRRDDSQEEDVDQSVNKDREPEIRAEKERVDTQADDTVDKDDSELRDVVDDSKGNEVVQAVSDDDRDLEGPEALEESTLDDLAGAALSAGQTDELKSSRFAIHQGQAVASREENRPKATTKADTFAKFEVDADADGGGKPELGTAKPVIEAKAPLTAKTPNRVAEFALQEGESQAGPKVQSSSAMSQSKSAENTQAEGEWMQMLQRNLPVDQVATRAQTIRTGDSVQLGSNRVTAISGPGLVQKVDRPAPAAPTQRAAPLHRPQLPEGVDEMTLMRQISDGLKIRPGQNQTAEIRLRPADLGRVLIQLQMSGDEAKVVVTTENAAVGDALSGGLDQLRRDIMAQGVQVTHMEVRQEGGENSHGQDQEQVLDEDGEEREGRPSSDDPTSSRKRKAKGRISVQA